MANKSFSRRIKSVSKNQWLSEARSRENSEISMRSETLRV